MAQIEGLVLPDVCDGLMTAEDYGIYGKWVTADWQSTVDSMREPTTTNFGDSTIAYLDHRHADDPGDNKAIAIPFPFGNGYFPSKHILASFFQDILPEHTRLLLFPNNTFGENWYEFGENWHNFDPNAPIADKLATSIVRVAEELDIEELSVVGNSQGAMIGGRMVPLLHEHFNSDEAGAFLVEPPNVAERTEKELSAAFRKGGLGAAKKAYNDSAIPVLSRSLRSRPGIGEATLGLLGLVPFALGSKQPVNHNLTRAMGRADFVESLGDPENIPGRFNVVRFGKSLICLSEIDEELRSTTHIPVDVIDDYGHEGGDNVVMFSLLARKSLDTPGNLVNR